MHKILLTHADDKQASLLDLTSPHYQRYADSNNYEFRPIRNTPKLSNRSPHWAKIALIRKHLQDCDVLVWIDNDILIRSRKDICQDFYPDDFQALVMENAPHGPNPNTGVWVLRNCSQAHNFLNAVWEKGPLPDAKLNDQATVAFLLGWSYLPWVTKPMYPSEYLAGTGWLSHTWNMIGLFHPEAPLIAQAIHYGGLAIERKIALISEQLVQDSYKFQGQEEIVEQVESLNELGESTESNLIIKDRIRMKKYQINNSIRFPHPLNRE